MDWKHKGYIALLTITLLGTFIYIAFIFSRGYASKLAEEEALLPLDTDVRAETSLLGDGSRNTRSKTEVLDDEVPVGSDRNLIAMEKAVSSEQGELAGDSASSDAFNRFEDEIFAYINGGLNKLLEAQEVAEHTAPGTAKSSQADFEAQLSNIGHEAIRRAATFKREHTLSAKQLKYLSEIELYINLQVLRDRLRSEVLITQMENGHGKISMVMSYLQTFAESEDHNVLRKFALQENTWARRLDGNFPEQVDLVLFKSYPIGQQFPNYFKNVKSIKNVSLDLKRFRGKIVLIDFWASWCVPCLQEIPYHKEVYYKYKDRQFDIIYVNLDTDEDAFLEVVEKHALPWHHLFEREGLQGKVARQYGVERLPSSFLIDGTGRVLAVDIKGTELRDMLSKLISS